MQLRLAQPGEVDAAFGLIEDARAHIAELGIDQWQNGWPTHAAIEQDIANDEGYVVEDDGQLLAYVMISDAGDSHYDEILDGAWLTDSLSENPDYLVLHRFAVGSEARRKGVATFILSEAERIAKEKGMHSMRIDTHANNSRMTSLLERCGFTKCGMILLEESKYVATRERITYEKLV